MKKIINKFTFLFKIHKSLPMFYRFVASKKIPMKNKLLWIGLMIGYILLPTDMLVDMMPILGWMDDVTVVAFLLDGMKKQYNRHHK